MATAGFDDFVILNQGANANAIALGAYRNRDTAERRATTLREAGFPAEVRAHGATAPSRWWLDGRSTDVAAVRTTFPAAPGPRLRHPALESAAHHAALAQLVEQPPCKR
ncbi:SPOR domain-containing protein [Pseudoxanthomonas sp. NC8]|nr:SPOR domain-containing protein [Pseudoxanthomonas sp. NC8]